MRITIYRDDLGKLKYLTMCIKESMRLHCPVPFIERVTTKDMVIDGKTVPPGSILAIQIYNLHHNPTVWTEPMVSLTLKVLTIQIYNLHYKQCVDISNIKTDIYNPAVPAGFFLVLFLCRYF